MKGGIGKDSDVRNEGTRTAKEGGLDATRCSNTAKRKMFETVMILVEYNPILLDHCHLLREHTLAVHHRIARIGCALTVLTLNVTNARRTGFANAIAHV